MHLPQQPIKQLVSSISSTKSDLLTKINHQDNSQSYAQCHQDVHQPRLLTNINKMYQYQYVLLILYQVMYTTSSINHVSTILLACTNHVSTIDQTMTHQVVPTSPYHTPHVCANSSTICLNMYPTCTSTIYQRHMPI
jgi:hypothetical protein